MNTPTLDIDLLAPEAIEDPHSYFRAIRERAPIAWSERHRAWIITGHPELDAAFRNPLFSTERMGAFKARLTGSRAEALEKAVALLDGWMLFHEPPEHTRLLAPLSRAFTVRTVRSLDDDVRSLCASLLDALLLAKETKRNLVVYARIYLIKPPLSESNFHCLCIVT